MLTVVTGFDPKGYELYGKKFIQTFHRLWPPSINLIVYHEDPIDMPRGGCISRWKPEGIGKFVEDNKDNAERCGLRARHGWQEKHRQSGYNYRFDAVKFCWQLFYPEDAAKSLKDGDILVWLDGDVITTDNARPDVIEASLQQHDLVHLGRTSQSELGFWAVRLNKDTRKFLKSLADTYRTGAVFNLDQWHSGYVFDHCLKSFGGRINNWTPNGTGNVWMKTPLAYFTVHLKGRLKQDAVKGRSSSALNGVTL